MSDQRRWMAVAVLVSLFLSGVAVGAVGVLLTRDPPSPTRSFQPRALGGPRAEVRSPVSPPAFVSGPVLQRLTDELELSAEQRDSVEAILSRQRAVTREQLVAVYPRLRASVDSVTAQIRRILDPDQRARFDEMGIPAGGPPEPPFESGTPPARR